MAEEGKKPSEGEVKTALSLVGCDEEPSGLFEIDHAKCKLGQYDLKLDKDFNITLMSHD